jgi:hypothetical protein
VVAETKDRRVKLHNVFIDINYDTAYQAVEIVGPGDQPLQKFATGDPVTDYRGAWNAATERAIAAQCSIMTGSSLTHFIWDIPGYKFDEDDNLQPDPRERIASLDHTCEACPSQWEGTLEDGTAFYVRYRGARLRIGFGQSVMAAITHACGPAPAVSEVLNEVEPLDGYITWEQVLPLFNSALLAR